MEDVLLNSDLDINATNQTEPSFYDIVLGFYAIGHVNTTFSLLFLLIGVPWNILIIAIIVGKKLFTRCSTWPSSTCWSAC